MKSPTFMEPEFPASSQRSAMFHVLPVPLEKTVSYGTGTADGPRAILSASCQVESFDGVGYPGEAGIYTAAPIDCSGHMQAVLDRLESAVKRVVDRDRIPIVLGGEHSLTLAPVRAFLAGNTQFGVVQVDAHADLRDEFEGDRFSHACVMRRVVDEGIPVVQVGVRSLCREEVEFRQNLKITHMDAAAIAADGLPDRLLPDNFPTDVYLTFDLDGLDASLMPATGTPEPGGLTWWQAVGVIERIAREGRRIVGFDVVELAPIRGLHAPEYLAAKLTYALMGFALRSWRNELG